MIKKKGEKKRAYIYIKIKNIILLAYLPIKQCFFIIVPLISIINTRNTIAFFRLKPIWE